MRDLKSKISIQSVNVCRNSVEVHYLVEGDCRKYFNLKEGSLFKAEYNRVIENTPKSIAVIPFIVNVLPIVWLTDAVLEVEELDKVFFDHISQFKKGYMDMYPQLNFKGKIEVKNILEDKCNPTDKVAVFFSGGVDAFATLIAHIEEKPTLITVWGADVKLEDYQGWKNVQEHVEKTAEQFDIESIFVKTNFRCFINEGRLDLLVHNSGDAWWHGFQHGIGLIGHAAPLAFVLNLKTIYIASSYTKDDHVTCASSPSIDNNIRFGGCEIIHDQYEYHRQDKISHICEYVEKNHKKIFLRVCWQSLGGKNCCHCEKCYRTIFGIIAESKFPSEYGFENIQEKLDVISQCIRKELIMDPMICIPYWKDIQKRFVENRKNIPQLRELNWIYSFNFNEINHSFQKRLILLINRCRLRVFKFRRWMSIKLK